ncbi:DinB family protein [Parapedobacter koreensis]|uniref:DinB superfamily protein n=1 Tax=Parapedobacter koreensis TaxID=332977 RepID=A0A1H7LSV0_9SPHI|nr:DinB family protein [Parapedobacter koreensis]SEL01992.1 DinB superfamily protein [Parapedobacter koreensis]
MQDSLSRALENAFDELLVALSSLDQEELNTVPFKGSWTAGQVGDHLHRSYDVVECLTGRTETTQRDPGAYIAPLSEQFLNFEIKMQSPDFILPTDEPVEKEQLLNGLKRRTSAILDFAVSGADMTLTCLDFELPTLGTLTRNEWLNFVLVHTMRHNYQLANIMHRLDNTLP